MFFSSNIMHKTKTILLYRCQISQEAFRSWFVKRAWVHWYFVTQGLICCSILYIFPIYPQFLIRFFLFQSNLNVTIYETVDNYKLYLQFHFMSLIIFIHLSYTCHTNKNDNTILWIHCRVDYIHLGLRGTGQNNCEAKHILLWTTMYKWHTF